MDLVLSALGCFPHLILWSCPEASACSVLATGNTHRSQDFYASSPQLGHLQCVPPYGTDAVLSKLEPFVSSFSHGCLGTVLCKVRYSCTYKVLLGGPGLWYITLCPRAQPCREVQCVEPVFLYQALVPVDACRPHSQQARA